MLDTARFDRDKGAMTTMIRKLMAAVRRPAARAAPRIGEYPLESEARLNAMHARVAVRKHLDILYGDVRIGTESYVDAYFRCLESTGTMLTPFSVFQRFQTRYDLLRYFLSTLGVAGGRVECGAYRGATTPCANVSMPVAPKDAYLNPMSYL